jgi:hypothetical protein
MLDQIDNQTALYNAQRKAVNDALIYVVFEGPRLVARVSFHYNRSNTACTCYLWVQAAGISKGTAKGGGYDRKSAAALKAAEKIPALDRCYQEIMGYAERVEKIRAALNHDDGHEWQRHLEAAGFVVYSAV